MLSFLIQGSFIFPMLFPTLTLLQPPRYLQASCPDVRSQYLTERPLVANTCRTNKSMMEGYGRKGFRLSQKKISKSF